MDSKGGMPAASAPYPPEQNFYPPPGAPPLPQTMYPVQSAPPPGMYPPASYPPPAQNMYPPAAGAPPPNMYPPVGMPPQQMYPPQQPNPYPDQHYAPANPPSYETATQPMMNQPKATYYPQQLHQPQGIPMQQQVVQVVSMPAVGPNPVSVCCPSCRQQMTTRIEYKSSPKTHLCAILLLIFCWPCFWVPYCYDCCKDVDHYCKNCDTFLGTFKG